MAVIGVEKWKSRLAELKQESKYVEMHALACECLRLSVPLFANPTPVMDLIRQAERYAESEACRKPGMTYEEVEQLRTSRGFMTNRQRTSLRDAGLGIVHAATRLDFAHIFATVALVQLAAMADAHLDEKLGDAGAVERASDRFLRMYFKDGELRSQLHHAFPDAAARLVSLLEGPEAEKTLDRLAVFRSFTIHKSFRHVASEQARDRGDPPGNPDHTGPAYKVRKLGEALGVQLTRSSTDGGRARTTLTEAGEALADWISFRPDLFI